MFNMSVVRLRQLVLLRSSISRIPTYSFLSYVRQLHVPGSLEFTKIDDESQVQFEKQKAGRSRASEFAFRAKAPLPNKVNMKRILTGDEQQDGDLKAEDENDRTSDSNTTDAEVRVTKTWFADSPAMIAFHEKLQRYDGFQFSHEDWETFENDALTENPDMIKKWDTMCMQLIYAYRCPQLAQSLVSYLWTKKSPPKISTLCLYMAVQGEHGRANAEQIILETFQKVQEMTELFDAITAKYIIIGLSATWQWRKALDIVEMAKLTATPGVSYYNPIVIAALGEDVEFAFQLLEEIGGKGMVPNPAVLRKVLQICQQSSDHSVLERYLDCVWKFSWQISPALAKELEQYFLTSPTEKWNCKWTTVDTVRGLCHACRLDMNRIEVASSDFEALQREFLERAVVGSNVYLKSNPGEVERFKDFVMEHAPFDIVLDALNIAFRRSGGNVARSKQLREMVHYFAREKHMRVLVLGRAHMQHWSRGDMAYINKHAKTFFTDNISSDDPFCLYATLYSGKDTMFVSGDFMRDHKFNLGLHLKDIFTRWQKSRQIVNFEVSDRGVFICMPSQYDCGPVKDAKGWHIPYDDGTADLRSSSQAVLCLRHKGQRAISSKKRTKKLKE